MNAIERLTELRDAADIPGLVPGQRHIDLARACIVALPALLLALDRYKGVAESCRDQWGDDYLWQKWGHDGDMREAEDALAKLDKDMQP